MVNSNIIQYYKRRLMMLGVNNRVLKLDMSGRPANWISVRESIEYHAMGMVIYELGEHLCTYKGGVNRLNFQRTEISTKSIIGVSGELVRPAAFSNPPSIDNDILFSRDKHVCAYCGDRYPSKNLSREHIHPVSRGGKDIWMNIVTACKSCNHKKANKTLDEANMELLYVPYVPNRYEHFILMNRNILVDQMDYLLQQVPKHSRLWQN